MNGISLSLVALGGALGSVLRAWTSTLWNGDISQGHFPWGTLGVNAGGTLLLAVVFVWGMRGSSLSPETRALIATGFCGGLTTFSTFSVETMLLWSQGARAAALAYLVLSIVTGLAAVALVWTLWPAA